MLTDIDTFNSSLLRCLVDTSNIDAKTLARAEALAEREHGRLDRILLRLGLIDESTLLRATCEVLGIDTFDDLAALQIDAARSQLLTVPYMTSRLVVPVVTSSGTQHIAMADPGDFDLVRELAFHLGAEVTLIGAPAAIVRRFLASFTASPETESIARGVQAERDQLSLRGSEIDGPVIKFVQEKLGDAVTQRASDIHFECAEDGLVIRFRVNGILVTQRVDPGLNHLSVLARLKVMSSTNVTERRLPQDGRLNATIAGRNIDFRFSSLPTQWGESIVCRVLDPRALRLGWDKLGFDTATTASICRIIEKPSGLFLVTGPTGSGKTTTLYTAVAHLNTPGRKIVTVEDPVEYNLPGVQQVQVHEEIGLTFARVLRAMLRHDPNVILIGEIRDRETAEIACRAAQVGRLVLSTLHTNSADGAFTRLIDLGVPEFVVREVLRGVLAQDLLTVPCDTCGGAGCDACNDTGVKGRRLSSELREYGAG